MEHCPLPIELCELIIDFIAEPYPWWQIPYWRTNPARYLVKYTCVCSAWLSRARLNLYRTITFHKTQHVELFIQSITANPALADMVCELVIKPVVTSRGAAAPDGAFSRWRSHRRSLAAPRRHPETMGMCQPQDTCVRGLRFWGLL
ncbi:hypothetical protein L226DRAFT_353270 [Lentinus tigrinus ALCF2SS1-7]|uniref:uncharacterized protein n=1 Tax=Lentinus tigrinus ALCF2SS1-7 TaxID=1328758 RepID=UPI0011661F2B|nr:hypothetical protein L226DRAFT_353270 [Lentinus tigrinus ALCF2SS1-7]